MSYNHRPSIFFEKPGNISYVRWSLMPPYPGHVSNHNTDEVCRTLFLQAEQMSDGTLHRTVWHNAYGFNCVPWSVCLSASLR